jgi:tetratricopeptide (TPR) repeat protein
MSIVDLNDSHILFEAGLQYLEKGKILEGMRILERIPEKNLQTLLVLLEYYERFQRMSDVVRILKQVIGLKPQKNYYSRLITLLKKNKRWKEAFHYLVRGSRFFPYDPDFKKQIIDFLIRKNKYRFASRYLKKNRNSICTERVLFYQGLLHREMGKKIRAWRVFRKLVKRYPFNMLYRYLLATVYQSFHLKRKSEEQISYVRNFVQQIPKFTRINEKTDPMVLMMQQMWEQVR